MGSTRWVGVIDGFRWALLGTKPPEAMILVSIGVVVVLLVGGLFYFKRMWQYFCGCGVRCGYCIFETIQSDN
ncbi:MAG: hypothetical protein STSR0009_12960 [Methanoregula sp.]